MKIKILALIFIFAPLFLFGQIKNNSSHSTSNLTCSNCHSCSIPTKENPCIKPCPRESMIRIDQKAEEGPRIIVINKLKDTDIYELAKFSHLAHAEMSDMTGGCRTCHHYNPPGNVIGCSECHESSRKRIDINKPDLKGAYHQQCVNCHRAWSGKTDCVFCHEIKDKVIIEKQTSTKEIKKRIHPEIRTPEKIVFKTNTNKGKLVTFYHNEHTSFFGLECSQCHSHESCVKCHQQINKSIPGKVSLAEHHKKCSSCHDTKTSCNNCHSNKESGSFDHKSKTGFDTSKFHSKIICNRCHTSKGVFSGLIKECASCHNKWTPEYFKHILTGLTLDDTHKEFECESCHKEKTFENPECTDCHDGYKYPEKLPGKVNKR
jgi:hypothetical protein